MANNDNDKPTGDKPTTQKLFVRSTTKEGFRRIGRHFGPEPVEVDATPEQAAILVNARPELEVLTPEMKAQLDAIATGQQRFAEARAKALAKASGKDS